MPVCIERQSGWLGILTLAAKAGETTVFEQWSACRRRLERVDGCGRGLSVSKRIGLNDGLHVADDFVKRAAMVLIKLTRYKLLG